MADEDTDITLNDESDTGEFWSTLIPDRDVSPEAGLMYAMLEDAIEVYNGATRDKKDKSGAEWREARDWLFTDDPDYALSVDNCCGTLGISLDLVRRKLKGRRGNYGGK